MSVIREILYTPREIVGSSNTDGDWPFFQKDDNPDWYRRDNGKKSESKSLLEMIKEEGLEDEPEFKDLTG